MTHLAHLPLRQQQSSLIRPCHIKSAARTQHPGASLVYRAVSDDTLGSFGSLFPGPSVLQCHGVFPSGTYVFAAASGTSSQQQSSQQSRSRYRASLVYRAVSDDTLGSFWSLFPGSSVLQCHGVFPSGTYVFAAASGRSSQSSQQQSSQQSRSR